MKIKIMDWTPRAKAPARLMTLIKFLTLKRKSRNGCQRARSQAKNLLSLKSYWKDSCKILPKFKNEVNIASTPKMEPIITIIGLRKRSKPEIASGEVDSPETPA